MASSTLLLQARPLLIVQGAGSGWGHYLDIERGIFPEAGLVNSETSVVAVVHDSQVSDQLVGAGSTSAKRQVTTRP